MSIEHDIITRWQLGQTSGVSILTATRRIIAAVSGSLDLSVPTGAANTPSAFSLLLSKVQSVFLLCDQAVTLKAGGVNAVQSLAMTGGATGGTFTLSFGGQTTAPVAWNASAPTVQAALSLLSTIGVGGVVCTGGPFPGTAVALTFAGLNAVQTVALVTGNPSGLTGGSTPAVTASTTTAGVNPDTTLNVLAGVPLVWDANGYYAQPFAADVATFYATNTSGASANLSLRTLSNA